MALFESTTVVVGLNEVQKWALIGPASALLSALTIKYGAEGYLLTQEVVKQHKASKALLESMGEL